jgi:hypothetical protein
MLEDLQFARYIILFPLIYVLTPSSAACVESVLFALSAPVLYGPSTGGVAQKESGGKNQGKEKDELGVRGGDIIRDCRTTR